MFASQEILCRLIDREAPTPLIMFSVKLYKTAYGMAVTANHNPAFYNGVKIFTSGGRDADETVTDSIEEYIRRGAGQSEIIPVPFERGLAEGSIVLIHPENDYIDSIIREINMDAIRGRHLRVALDPMYGVSKTSLQTILLTARCDVDVIHERRDTLFGGRLPAPNSETLGALTEFVRENDCDIGIATDGDADRIGVVDNEARFLHPNQILVLLYYYLVKYKGLKGPAVRNIMTTHLLDRVCEDFGETCYEVPVGFKHISSKMSNVGALIGGESSGGLTVRGHIQGKDGIYAAALLVEMIAVTGKALSENYAEIVGRYGEIYTAELDSRFSEERKNAIVKLLIEEKKLPEFSLPVDRVAYLDGCKVYFKNGGLCM